MRQVIDHDPEEPPRDTSKSPWGRLAVILVLLWTSSFFLLELHWHSVVLGLGTGACLMAWGLEYTGNRVPVSWRKPPGSRRT